RLPPHPPLFPYTTLFRSEQGVVGLRRGGQRQQRGEQQRAAQCEQRGGAGGGSGCVGPADQGGHLRRLRQVAPGAPWPRSRQARRSEEHTSELQSRENLVC